MNINDLAYEVKNIIKEASSKVMEIYSLEDVEIIDKQDGSPVTKADHESNEIIIKGLRDLDPNIPILSEEGSQFTKEEHELFWMIDPLDGTKEFINKNGEFTVNIALIHKGEPILGLVSAPAIDETFIGINGEGSFKISGERESKIKPSSVGKTLSVTISRSHQSQKDKDFINSAKKFFEGINKIETGSSLKLCRVAEGAADIYCRFGPTYQWDIAAGQAVVISSGGKVNSLEGDPLTYRFDPEKKNPEFYCIGDVSYDWKSLISSF